MLRVRVVSIMLLLLKENWNNNELEFTPYILTSVTIILNATKSQSIFLVM